MDDADTAPDLVTAPALRGVLDELRAHELFFLGASGTATRADIEARIDDGFFEIGASGRRYGRDAAVDVLVDRLSRESDDDAEASDFSCRALGGELFAVTWTLKEPARLTRRFSLWRRVDGAWRILFHQGTVVTT